MTLFIGQDKITKKMVLPMCKDTNVGVERFGEKIMFFTTYTNLHGLCTGDVICSDYSRDVHGDLNTIRSYLNLAVKETCRCLPSMTLLKHSRAGIRHINHSCFHPNGGACGWMKANCEMFCTTCIHYCGIQHGC